MQEILPPLPAPRGRYDGWTVARQEAFCAALAKGSTVQEACAIVGKSTTSAYKARDRIRGFSNRWNAGLEAAKPNIEAEVYRRAVEGWDEPVFHGGKQVGVRRRYSDALLKMLAQRGFTAPQMACRPRMPIEEVERVLSPCPGHSSFGSRFKRLAARSGEPAGSAARLLLGQPTRPISPPTSVLSAQSASLSTA